MINNISIRLDFVVQRHSCELASPIHLFVYLLLLECTLAALNSGVCVPLKVLDRLEFLILFSLAYRQWAWGWHLHACMVTVLSLPSIAPHPLPRCLLSSHSTPPAHLCLLFLPPCPSPHDLVLLSHGHLGLLDLHYSLRQEIAFWGASPLFSADNWAI